MTCNYTYDGKCWCSTCVLDRFWCARTALAVAAAFSLLGALTVRD